jgi:hypothetical protein
MNFLILNKPLIVINYLLIIIFFVSQNLCLNKTQCYNNKINNVSLQLNNKIKYEGIIEIKLNIPI